MNVSIIIVNYNTKNLTKACVDSVFHHTKNLAFEVILVDNASTDGSKEYFENDSRICYVYLHDNIGFGGANNTGYKYTSGDYIFFLNSDTILVNNAIYELYHFFESAESKIGCVGCVLTDENGNPMHSYGLFPTMRTYLNRILAFYHIYLNSNSDKPKEQDVYPLYVDYVTGADLFIRRHVIEECGLFDPAFFMYYEETDLQYRFREKGYHALIINTPRIIHLQGASCANVAKKGRKSLRIAQIEVKSRLVYAQKHFGKNRAMLVSLLHLLMIPKILLYNAIWSEKKNEIGIILSSFRRIE